MKRRIKKKKTRESITHHNPPDVGENLVGVMNFVSRVEVLEHQLTVLPFHHPLPKPAHAALVNQKEERKKKREKRIEKREKEREKRKRSVSKSGWDLSPSAHARCMFLNTSYLRLFTALVEKKLWSFFKCRMYVFSSSYTRIMQHGQ